MMDMSDLEAGRLAALGSYHILDTPPEPEFDALVKEAASLLGTPIALISLIDEQRQWFKSRIGLSVEETPRSVSFCAHAIAGDEVLVVENASQDQRFMNNPLVRGDPNIRFYAGAVLQNNQGHRLGTICVIDTQTRPDITPEMIAGLRGISHRVINALEERMLKGSRGREQAADQKHELLG